jgi:CDP-4-dehydro-6-deoxyglucose reductase
MTAGSHQQARLIESVALNAEIRHYVFESLGEEEFAFEPGQYMALSKAFDSGVLKRYYSIASPPNGTSRFELCINAARDTSPFGDYLRRMQPGEVLDYEGPAGTFQLNRPVRPSVFVAHGTGIAPIRSMLGYLLDSGETLGAGAPLTLIYGARNPEWLLYEDEFLALEKQHANFRYWPTLSRPGGGWPGRRGYVQMHLEPALNGHAPAMDFYLCGRVAMVSEVHQLLLQAGLDDSSVRYEQYG